MSNDTTRTAPHVRPDCQCCERSMVEDAYGWFCPSCEEMFGGETLPIVRTPEQQAELERGMEYVDREGHQPP